MTGDITRASHTEGAVADYFVIESHILSTRSADAYKAIDRGRNQASCLWMLRHPLARNSDAVRRFLARLDSIRAIQPAVCDLRTFGVDSAGMAFAVLPDLDGQPITAGNLEVHEAERRFIACLKLVAQLHLAGVVCGDLCGSSFFVERGGDLRFIGVMGSFDSEAAATAMLPPMETMTFVAPEQRSGGGIEPATDVFALGVLGYFLFTGKYPFGSGAQVFASDFDVSQVQPIREIVGGQPPAWVDDVVMNCLQSDPAARYQSAGEVWESIVSTRQRNLAAESVPARVNQIVRKGAQDGLLVRPATAKPPPAEEAAAAAEPSSKRGLAIKTALGVVIGLAVALTVGRKFLDSGGDSKLSKDLSSHRSVVGSEQLKKAIDVIAERDASIAERAAQFEKIVSSDDPIAHDILVKSARDAKTAELRTLAEKAIIDRARRLGLMRSAEQVRQWLRTLRGPDLAPSYEAVLQSLDTTLPMEARSSSLRQAYASHPDMVLRLTAALALDSEQLDSYQPLLAQLVGDTLRIENASELSALALILASPELSVVFGDDVIQRREQIPDRDIPWLLKELAERNDLNVRPLANLALERGLLDPLSSVFLSVVRDRSDLPPDVLSGLIRGAAGIPKVTDITSFGRWYDLESERVLLAILATSTDQSILSEAFDTVAGKSLVSNPAGPLVGWVRQNYWDERLNFAHAIGIFSNLDRIDPAKIDVALKAFDRYVKDPSLIEIFLDTKNATLIKQIVDNYANLLGLGGLLNLLAYDDKQIRITAVHALKGYNDIGALKLIIDAYEREKDPEVREAYKETFWVIRQREQ